MQLIWEHNDLKTEPEDYLKRLAGEGMAAKREDIRQFFEEFHSKKRRRVWAAVSVARMEGDASSFRATNMPPFCNRDPCHTWSPFRPPVASSSLLLHSCLSVYAGLSVSILDNSAKYTTLVDVTSHVQDTQGVFAYILRSLI